MGLTLEEQETHISIERTCNVAKIYTTDLRYMTKLDKLTENSPEFWKFTGSETMQGEVISKTYECPAKFISFRQKEVKARPMTEEQKRTTAERLRNARNKARITEQES